MPKFLTVRDVCAMLPRSRKTIWRWLQEGEMFPNARKIKDGWLIPESDVQKLVGQVTAR